MAEEILICLSAEQWKRLEPHLPEDVCPNPREPDEGTMPMLDGRFVPDEATYQKVLGVAKKECPDLVREIEKHRKISESD